MACLDFGVPDLDVRVAGLDLGETDLGVAGLDLGVAGLAFEDITGLAFAGVVLVGVPGLDLVAREALDLRVFLGDDLISVDLLSVLVPLRDFGLAAAVSFGKLSLKKKLILYEF